MFVHQSVSKLHTWLFPTILYNNIGGRLPAEVNFGGRQFGRSLISAKAAQTGAIPFDINGQRVFPPMIFAIGLNYASHAREMKRANPEQPIVFAKSPNTLIASGEHIEIPFEEPCVDFEGELAAIIGPEPCRSVSKEDALRYQPTVLESCRRYRKSEDPC